MNLLYSIVGLTVSVLYATGKEKRVKMATIKQSSKMAGIQPRKGGDTMENFLRKIASETENIIRNDAKKAQFLKSIEAYREMREKFLQALQQCKNEAVENQLFYDENAAEPPMGKEKLEQGWELEKDYLIEIPAQPRSIYRAFWRSPLPFDLDAWIMHHYGSPFYNSIVATPRVPKEPKEPDNAENLICEYVVLAVIHDCLWAKPKSQKLIEVDDSNWVDSWWNSIKWFRQLNGDNYKNRIHNINQALKNVEANLPNKPTETEQDVTPIEKEKEKVKTVGSVSIQNSNVILGDVQADNLQIGDNAQIHKKQKAENPPETAQSTALGKLARIRGWFKRHPHRYGLAVAVIFLILFIVLGLLKAQWRQWCWGVAGLAFLVLLVSLLGGKSR